MFHHCFAISKARSCDQLNGKILTADRSLLCSGRWRLIRCTNISFSNVSSLFKSLSVWKTNLPPNTHQNYRYNMLKGSLCSWHSWGLEPFKQKMNGKSFCFLQWNAQGISVPIELDLPVQCASCIFLTKRTTLSIFWPKNNKTVLCFLRKTKKIIRRTALYTPLSVNVFLFSKRSVLILVI